ncbi:DUF4919 domain-containing protein [Flavobacterium sp. 3HN19-14]|uniref:DUF4919 domain-containing protein n=1 Tax=Flavobacterium sp. 3HN19-14 TaxID=3448133 RepID=UPI003EE2C840
MKKIAFLLLVFPLGVTYSQAFEKPDYKKIETEISDSTSAFFYPKLMKRLADNDISLTTDEYRYLYYGYFFQPEYSSNPKPPEQEKLFKYFQYDKLNPADYDEIIRLCTNAIKAFPFDIREMNFLSYVYQLKGDKEMAKKIAHTFQGLVSAIKSSGNGDACETGFQVLTVGHEYVLMSIWNLEVTTPVTMANCNYLMVEKGKYKSAGIYFNIEKIHEVEAKRK